MTPNYPTLNLAFQIDFEPEELNESEALEQNLEWLNEGQEPDYFSTMLGD